MLAQPTAREARRIANSYLKQTLMKNAIMAELVTLAAEPLTNKKWYINNNDPTQENLVYNEIIPSTVRMREQLKCGHKSRRYTEFSVEPW